jgi:hypothetical protein
MDRYRIGVAARITALVVSALAVCALVATPAFAKALTAQQIANKVLALKQTKPAKLGLFSTYFYPTGPSMIPASGPKLTKAQARQRLKSYFEKQRGGSSGRTSKALAVFDDPKVVAKIPSPTLRAAFAGMVGTILEPTINDFLKRGIFTGVGYGITFPTTLIAQSQPDSSAGAGKRKIAISSRYERESFEPLIAILGHEVQHSDQAASNAEEAVMSEETAMVRAQVLSGHPELAYKGTELARRLNDFALAVQNSRHPRSPNPVIFAPDGLGTIPGSPNSESDMWSLLDGSGSSPAPAVSRTIFKNILRSGTKIPNPLTFNLTSAKLFEKLNDNWLSDVQRLQIGVLLQMVSLKTIADTARISQSQAVAKLHLAPYLAPFNGAPSGGGGNASNAACEKARGAVKAAKQKLAKAKRALKRAKKTHKHGKIVKAKRKVKKAKAALRKAQGKSERVCS